MQTACPFHLCSRCCKHVDCPVHGSPELMGGASRLPPLPPAFPQLSSLCRLHIVRGRMHFHCMCTPRPVGLCLVSPSYMRSYCARALLCAYVCLGCLRACLCARAVHSFTVRQEQLRQQLKAMHLPEPEAFKGPPCNGGRGSRGSWGLGKGYGDRRACGFVSATMWGRYSRGSEGAGGAQTARCIASGHGREGGGGRGRGGSGSKS